MSDQSAPIEAVIRIRVSPELQADLPRDVLVREIADLARIEIEKSL